jgi:short-subunit dehydrogenase
MTTAAATKSGVFITGGSTGIGEALASLYATQGFLVGVCARSKDKWKSSKNAQNPNVTFYSVDVQNLEELTSAFLDFSKKVSVEIFFANAGIGNNHKDLMPEFKFAKEMFLVNTISVLNSAEVVFPYFHEKKKGKFVITSSVAGLNGLPGNGIYCASKSAVLKMAESWAIDWKQFGIDVYCLLPGFIDTPLTKDNNHSMPFLMSAAASAEIIYNKVQKKSPIIGFPWKMIFLTTILSIIPRNYYIKLMNVIKSQVYKKH